MNPALSRTLLTILAAAIAGAATAVPALTPFAPALTAIAGALIGAAHAKRPGDVTGAQLSAVKDALTKYEASK